MSIYIMNTIKMLYFDIIHVSGGIDVNKKSASEGWNICHYCYFLYYCFSFQQNICNKCLGLLVMSMNLSDIAIFSIKGSNHYCIVYLD